MKRILAILCLLVGVGLLAVIIPMYDIMMVDAMIKGGVLAVFTFIVLLFLGGVTFMFLGFYLWRR